jgi:hypothetical protein
VKTAGPLLPPTTVDGICVVDFLLFYRFSLKEEAQAVKIIGDDVGLASTTVVSVEGEGQ